jgi:L-lactate dehydrogenase (cytochrome)
VDWCAALRDTTKKNNRFGQSDRVKAASVYDYRRLAKKRVPHFLFEYLDGGSYAEVTKERNRADLESLALRQRILRDVSDIDTTVALFGHDYRMPVGLAPVGLAGMYARRGELQVCAPSVRSRRLQASHSGSSCT